MVLQLFKRLLFVATLLPGYSALAQDSLANNDTLAAAMNVVDTSALTNGDSLSLKKTKDYERQLRVMVDLFNPISKAFAGNQYGYELSLDYNISKDAFLVLEAGRGGGKVDYEHLKYAYNNTFLKVGIERSWFDPMYRGDWDMLLIGLRYGIGFGQRGVADYTIPNPFGQAAQGSSPAQNYIAHWGEITAGLRFELFPRVYTGWNVRMRFHFNSGIFDGAVAPLYLAGFGPADKSTAFGFNYYIGYALRWHKQR